MASWRVAVRREMRISTDSFPGCSSVQQAVAVPRWCWWGGNVARVRNGGTYPKNYDGSGDGGNDGDRGRRWFRSRFQLFSFVRLITMTATAVANTRFRCSREFALPALVALAMAFVMAVFIFFVPSLRLPSPEKCRQLGVYACGRTVRAFRCLRCRMLARTARTIESC